jgi:DNA-binding LytR/AlgR family response regulator
MLKAIVVDDEYPARKELLYILQMTRQVEVIAEFETGEEALAFIDNKAPDVVFLDIRMHGSDGLRVAELINARMNPPLIVFTTGYSEYAARAFELNVENYVMKPYAPARIQAVVQQMLCDRAEKIVLEPNKSSVMFKRLTIWDQDRMVVLKADEIHFIKSEGIHTTLIDTERGSFSSRQTLRTWEARLSGTNFLRVHKSYLVNMEHVCEVYPWFNSSFVVSIGKSAEQIPVGRRYLKEFCSIMGI